MTIESRGEATAPVKAKPGKAAELPPCPGGWEVGPPDFVGVGADRSGTTWWYSLIVSHPGVACAPGSQKEVHFFDAFFDGTFSDADVDRYREYFPRPGSKLAGEWTPRYMYDVWTPRLLARCAPATRILVMLRDPLERYRSQLRSAIANRGTNQFLGHVFSLALSRSLYADPLLRVLDHFSRERVLILQHEQCVRDPASFLCKTFEFLELAEPDFMPVNAATPVNAGPIGIEVPRPLEDGIAQTFARDAARLVEIEPAIDLGLWPSVSRSSGAL